MQPYIVIYFMKTWLYKLLLIFTFEMDIEMIEIRKNIFLFFICIILEPKCKFILLYIGMKNKFLTERRILYVPNGYRG